MALSASRDPVLVIAGRGELAHLIAQTLGARAHVIALRGIADPKTQALASHEIPLGKFGHMIEVGQTVGAKHVIFIGGVDRPAAQALALDDFSRQNLNLADLNLGDDGALRAIAGLFTRAGLETVGPLDLIPDLTMPARCLTRAIPDEVNWADAIRGGQVACALGRLDVGQAAVIQQGLVLAVEGIEGTDALITRTQPLVRQGVRPILVKVAKPQQDMRLDVPTLGPRTIENLAAAGFAGVFLEVGRTLIVDRPRVIERADAAGLFIAGLELGGLEELGKNAP